MLRGKDIRVNFGLNFRVPFLGPSKEEKEKGGQKWRLLKDPLLDPLLDPTFASILYLLLYVLLCQVQWPPSEGEMQSIFPKGRRMDVMVYVNMMKKLPVRIHKGQKIRSLD